MLDQAQAVVELRNLATASRWCKIDLAEERLARIRPIRAMLNTEEYTVSLIFRTEGSLEEHSITDATVLSVVEERPPYRY